jgi:iron only hydrogenase large subunit-like protein
MVAPSIVGQFGLKVKPDQIYTALKMAGFSDVVEVAIGADIVSVEEAEEYIEKVPEKQPYMTSSCCPAFVKIVKKYVGDAADKISHTVSPMVATGRWLKEQYPDAVTVFIGPCIAKKSEAKENPEYIDYVLTFEEAMCLMEGKDIKVENVEAVEFERDGSKVGLGFPLTAGVTAAVNATVNAKGGSVRATHYAAGVDKCVTDLTAVTKGQIDCSYFEGMACSNGCIDGPGTVGDFRLTKVALSKYAEVAPVTAAVDSKHTK